MSTVAPDLLTTDSRLVLRSRLGAISGMAAAAG